MSFIKNNGVVIGQYLPVISSAKTEVGKEQMMIYKDDVGFHRITSHSCYKTAVEFRAFLSNTAIGTSIDVRPEGEVFR